MFGRSRFIGFTPRRLQPAQRAAAAAAFASARSWAFLPGTAFCGLLRGLALHQAGGVEEAQDAVGRLGALGEPGCDLLVVEGDAGGIVLRLHRVVGADLLDEAAVARASGRRPRRCGNRDASSRHHGSDGS